jgi:ketosteroid isomerase-like protein
MVSRADLETVITEAYAARAAKDLDAVARAFHPNASFEIAGSSATFPGAARVEGEAQIRGVMGALIQTFDFLEHKLLASVIEGNKAAMHWRVRLRHNPSGKVVDTELFDLWTIEGGRAVAFKQFCDTALAADLLKG